MDATEAALAVAGLALPRDAMSETFARLTVLDRDEGCRIDFAADVRIREPDTAGSTTVLSLEELAADKGLALFGRAAARDFQAALRRHLPQLHRDLALHVANPQLLDLLHSHVVGHHPPPAADGSSADQRGVATTR